APNAPAAPSVAAADAARPWTVQVSSFRSRALADELRSQLTAKGFDAYLVSVTTEEGRGRHRGRVGGVRPRGRGRGGGAGVRGGGTRTPSAPPGPRGGGGGPAGDSRRARARRHQAGPDHRGRAGGPGR